MGFWWAVDSGGVLVVTGLFGFFFFLINLEFWFLWDFSGQWWHSGHGGHVYIWL